MEEQCNWEYPDGPTDNGCAVKYIDAPQDYQDYSILGFAYLHLYEQTRISLYQILSW